MHSNLALHLHSDCTEIIEKLQNCHLENKFKKFLGACNDIDREMVRCLTKEREARRKRNFEKSNYFIKERRELNSNCKMFKIEPIENSVVLDINYPNVNERYYEHFYCVPLTRYNNYIRSKENNEKSYANNPVAIAPITDTVKKFKMSTYENESNEIVNNFTSKMNESESRNNIPDKNEIPIPCGLDTLVMLHSNRLAVITLAHRHPVLSENKVIDKINFTALASKKRKKRGQETVNPFSLVCTICCEDGTCYPVNYGVQGQLIEVNEKLETNPNLLVKHPTSEGYIAIVNVNLRNVTRNTLFNRIQYNQLYSEEFSQENLKKWKNIMYEKFKGKRSECKKSIESLEITKCDVEKMELE